MAMLVLGRVEVWNQPFESVDGNPGEATQQESRNPFPANWANGIGTPKNTYSKNGFKDSYKGGPLLSL